MSVLGLATENQGQGQAALLGVSPSQELVASFGGFKGGIGVSQMADLTETLGTHVLVASFSFVPHPLGVKKNLFPALRWQEGQAARLFSFC